MRASISALDLLLRREQRFRVGLRSLPWLEMALVVVACGGLYGLAMGSFAASWRQAAYSAVKVPMLLAVTTLVCLPNFYVVNLLLQLGDDYLDACKAIFAAQATAAIALASFAPVTLAFYLGTDSYPFALLLNAALFGAATVAGQVTLAHHYRPLIARSPSHRKALIAWFVLYAFVAIKLASILRPFVGDPRAPRGEFFRETAFTENPYTSLFWSAVYIGYRFLRALAGD